MCEARESREPLDGTTESPFFESSRYLKKKKRRAGFAARYVVSLPAATISLPTAISTPATNVSIPAATIGTLAVATT